MVSCPPNTEGDGGISIFVYHSRRLPLIFGIIRNDISLAAPLSLLSPTTLPRSPSQKQNIMG
jgi:hypothetical protein